MFKFFDYAIHNAYLLYKHNCRNFGVKRPMSMKKFRLGVVHVLAKDTRLRVRKLPFSSVSNNEGPCCLERVAKIVMG